MKTSRSNPVLYLTKISEFVLHVVIYWYYSVDWHLVYELNELSPVIGTGLVRRKVDIGSYRVIASLADGEL